MTTWLERDSLEYRFAVNSPMNEGITDLHYLMLDDAEPGRET